MCVDQNALKYTPKHNLAVADLTMAIVIIQQCE